MPTELPPSRWEFPTPDLAGDEDLVGQGADLDPATILAAYRKGIFPMPVRRSAPTAWWSPAQRGILPVTGLRVSRSLRQSCARFTVRVDTVFPDVIEACADPGRPGGWITPEIIAAYVRLHELGWAHSVEAWTPEGQLAGGLYGLAIGGLFAGESMFHRVRDASKVALVGLVDILAKEPDAERRLLDLQWRTPHLASLGAIEIPRAEYLARLDQALRLPSPPAFGGRTEEPRWAGNARGR
ncbi:leucyl/phenylalanyl-tRNA--protein transferase [Actinopolymorpha singaporensis]|uniref:Leucyl/phenylalanyl-tRNA--protein transferase n=1 Tax=Actinopolymorpha singaporensis TaxID=117157 RepID=A0A1H1NCP3_9ACTN|nr:leucyl/phenylalanyl-tRNA--protein transferase [Actinopolymorpha singaporensis]SDR96713.1 leucyl/phenylalanyl-tRNA--protein transferase [Actinopolymorpha singaporensis]